MSNYGLVVIVMVLIIRIILSPLTYKSHISMAKCGFKTELDAIRKKHDGDVQKAQPDQVELYRKVGINPLAWLYTCFTPVPILVSLFLFYPSAIELRLESFLWADDLSSYDSILNLPFNMQTFMESVSLFYTLLMAGSTILYTMANSQMTTIQGPMKTMQYLIHIMFLFFFNSYPSGLSYYYFITNLVSFGQIVFRKFINEDKIKLIMEENKKLNVNKKKSKFQLRLEEAMKANQAAQKSKGKKINLTVHSKNFIDNTYLL